MAVKRIAGRVLVPGSAEGKAIVTSEPLSFWGGVDLVDGKVIDKRHPLVDSSIAGRILVLPSGRGSCSASGVLLEAIANGTAPAGIIVSELDPIIGLGAILGDELLGRVVPVILVTPAEHSGIPDGAHVIISASGAVEIQDDAEV